MQLLLSLGGAGNWQVFLLMFCEARPRVSTAPSKVKRQTNKRRTEWNEMTKTAARCGNQLIFMQPVLFLDQHAFANAWQHKRMALLPLHPQTSTSLSVWVPAFSPDAAEPCRRRSCSREARGEEKTTTTNKWESKQTNIYKGANFLSSLTKGTSVVSTPFNELRKQRKKILHPGVTEAVTINERDVTH